eukprot:m.128503 g.128503  ORF g.128503 m.128503 type:complete len:947 (-) comp13872_c2_seq1:463-3303(-)
MADKDAIMLKLQSASYRKGIRFNEYFRDFDKLRRGRVSTSQFARCIQLLGVYLTPDQVTGLTNRYLDDGGEVLYRTFCSDVDAAVVEDPHLEKTPGKQIPHPTHKLTKHTYALDDPELEALYEEIRVIVQKHCATYGSSVRTAFQEFDRVNRGLVTQSQFERNLPAPTSMPPLYVNLLVKRFSHPESGMVDYLAFHRDVENIRKEEPLGFRHTLGAPRAVQDIPGSSVLLGSAQPTDRTAEDLVKVLQKNFFVTRVRPLEYMRDYDKLRSSFITANQFECSLSLALSAPKSIKLTRSEMQTLVTHYSAPDGRINYRKFCTDVDNAFLTGTDKDLVNDPLANTPQLRRSELVSEKNVLTQEQEDDVAAVLDEIRSVIAERQLDLYPAFKEVDRKAGFTRGVTPAQFHRLLDSSLPKPIHSDVVQLLVQKYGNPATGHVNYMAFLGDVDPLTRLQQGDQLFFDKTSLARFPTLKDLDGDGIDDDQADFDAAFALLQAGIVERSLRASEVFRDFDKRRKGLLTADQFKRGLKLLQPDMTAAMLNAVTRGYTKANEPPPFVVEWKRFSSDMDDVLVGDRSLEKSPMKQIGDINSTLRTISLAAQATPEQKGFSDQNLADFEEAMESIRIDVVRFKLDYISTFRGFDKLNRGRVTRAQFRQGLDMARFNLTPMQKQLIEEYYAEGSLVNYRNFVTDVEPPAVIPNLTQQTQAATARVHTARSAQREDTLGADVDQVMSRLKIHVAKERIRLKEHLRDFDKLRTGKVTSAQFRSGLSMAKVSLTLPEYAALETAYAAPDREGVVRYADFCADVDTVFNTPDLHLDPTKDAVQLIPPVDIEMQATIRKIDQETEEASLNTLKDVAAVVYQRRLNVIEDFKDYDRLKRGAISRAQFMRVLMDLGLMDVSSQQRAFNSLAERYTVSVGGRDDVHYRRFVDDLESVVQNIHSTQTA